VLSYLLILAAFSFGLIDLRVVLVLWFVLFCVMVVNSVGFFGLLCLDMLESICFALI